MSPAVPPPLSVVLAVYNGRTYLREAVDSILGQGFGDFELIAIDDGSTDDTATILREYAAADARVRLVSRPNKGLTQSLNEGLVLARGTFIARMDADDVCEPDRFERQVAHLRAHPDCVLVGSRVLLTDPDGLPIRQPCDELTHDEIDHAHLSRGWPVVHPAVTMRADAVRRVGGYRDAYNTLEDLDLFLRLAEVGKLANLPAVLLRYRQHFGSVTHRKEAEQNRIRQAIYDETAVRRGGEPVPPPDVPIRTRPRRPFEQHRLWAWMALKGGHVTTARKHALATLKRSPWHLDHWRLMACAIRGH